MRNFDKMFKEEQEKINVKENVENYKKQQEKKVLVDFLEDGLIDFLDYLNDNYYVQRHSVNYHIDREVYERDIVESRIIYDKSLFISGIQYKWSNGGLRDTLTVKVVDYKAVLTYEGVQMDLDTFISTVIRQITDAINKPQPSFKIIKL